MDVANRWKSLAAAVLIAMVPTAAPAAEPDPFEGRLIPLELIMAHRAEIGLSSDQRGQIRELVVGMQQAVAGRRWEMQSAYLELMDLLDAPEIDEDEAIALAKQAVDTENAIKLEQMRLLIRLRNLLTPEQVATLRSLGDANPADAGG